MKVRADCTGRTGTTIGNISHLVSLQGLTDDHITDQFMPRGCEVRRYIRHLVANILLGRLAQFVKTPKWNGRRAQSWHYDSRDEANLG